MFKSHMGIEKVAAKNKNDREYDLGERRTDFDFLQQHKNSREEHKGRNKKT